jgi:putative ABC transport system ATP-binding protein
MREQCEGGAAAVLVTHESRHAAWADRVVFLRDGRVVDEAVNEPRTPNGDAMMSGGRP